MVKYDNALRLLIFNSAVESTLLLICVHLPPPSTPADVSFVVADIA